MSTLKVVTFYSYKGGTGRTMALANVAWLAARWGRKVLCIDWDLEAPGLDTWLGVHEQRATTPGLVELILAERDGSRPDWRDFRVPVERVWPGSIDLIHAGRSDGTYLERMQAIEWKRLYAEQGLGDTIERWRAEWLDSYDLVLIDSRTGVTDTGSICAAQLPDVLVVLFNPNDQNLRGGVETIEAARRARDRMEWDRAPMHVVPVVTRLENRVEYERAESWKRKIVDAVGGYTETWRHISLSAESVLEHLRIPYVPYWSFGEDLAAEKSWSDPEDVGYHCASLAMLLIDGLVGTLELVNNRAALEARVDPRGSGSDFPEEIYILHESRQRDLAAELLARLRHRGVRASASFEDWDEPAEIPWAERAMHVVALHPPEPGRRFRADQEVAKQLQSLGRRECLVLDVGPATVAGDLEKEIWQELVSEARELLALAPGIRERDAEIAEAMNQLLPPLTDLAVLLTRLGAEAGRLNVTREEVGSDPAMFVEWTRSLESMLARQADELRALEVRLRRTIDPFNRLVDETSADVELRSWLVGVFRALGPDFVSGVQATVESLHSLDGAASKISSLTSRVRHAKKRMRASFVAIHDLISAMLLRFRDLLEDRS